MHHELNSSQSRISLQMIVILNMIKYDLRRPASEV
jgi:hypothetical protein